MSQEAHYECVVSGELLPESEMQKVRVKRIKSGSHDPVSTDGMGKVRVSDDVIPENSVHGAMLYADPSGNVILAHFDKEQHSETYGISHYDSSVQDNLQTICDVALN